MQNLINTAAATLANGTDLLEAIRFLIALLPDRRERVHLACAVQEVQDWRAGKT